MSLLKSLARRLLVEAEEVEKEPGEDSLDAQVDRYLLDYESEAKNSKNEGRSFRSLSRRFLIEAGEDEEKKGAEEEKESEKESEKLTEEDIDLGNFSAGVMRLIENYDSLLEVRNTILRRSVNFLAKNYDKDVVDSFREEVLESYGIEIGKSDFEKSKEVETPAAARAGASPGGG